MCDKDIERCKELTEPRNANWIGISNQKAIAHLIDRIKELEEENGKLNQILNKINETNYPIIN